MRYLHGMRLLPAATVLLTAGLATAGETLRLREGMGGVADIGATRCDYYAYIHPNGPSGFDQSVLYWLEGYVHARTGKAIDAFLAGVPNGADWTFDRIGSDILDHCTRNPGQSVADAIIALWVRMNANAD